MFLDMLFATCQRTSTMGMLPNVQGVVQFTGHVAMFLQHGADQLEEPPTGGLETPGFFLKLSEIKNFGPLWLAYKELQGEFYIPMGTRYCLNVT